MWVKRALTPWALLILPPSSRLSMLEKRPLPGPTVSPNSGSVSRFLGRVTIWPKFSSKSCLSTGPWLSRASARWLQVWERSLKKEFWTLLWCNLFSPSPASAISMERTKALSFSFSWSHKPGMLERRTLVCLLPGGRWSRRLRKVPIFSVWAFSSVPDPVSNVSCWTLPSCEFCGCFWPAKASKSCGLPCTKETGIRLTKEVTPLRIVFYSQFVFCA